MTFFLNGQSLVFGLLFVTYLYSFGILNHLINIFEINSKLFQKEHCSNFNPKNSLKSNINFFLFKQITQPYALELAANYPSVVVSQMTESDFGQPKVTPTHLVDGVTGVPVLPDGLSSVLINPAPMEQPQPQLPLELYQLTGKLEDGNLLLETQMPQMNMMVDNNTGQHIIRLDQTQIVALQNKNNVTINMPVPLPLGLNPDLTDMEQLSSGVTIPNDPLQSTVTTEALMHDGPVGQLHDSVGPPVGSLRNMSIDEIVRAIIIHSLVQYKTTTFVFDRSDCNDFIFYAKIYAVQ